MADAPINPFARTAVDSDPSETETMPTFNIATTATAPKKSGPKGPGSSGPGSSGPRSSGTSNGAGPTGPKGPGNEAGSFDDFVIDMSDVTSTGGGGDPYVAPGDRVAYVSSCSMDKAGTGNMMIVVKWTFVDGEYANVTKTDRIVLVKNALWRLDMYCNALGIGLDEYGRKPTFGDIQRQMVERVALLKITPDKEYNGNPKTQIFGLEPLDGAPVGLTITDYRAALRGE